MAWISAFIDWTSSSDAARAAETGKRASAAAAAKGKFRIIFSLMISKRTHHLMRGAPSFSLIF